MPTPLATRTPLEANPGAYLEVGIGKVLRTPSIGLTVRNGSLLTAVHLSPEEARAHAKALLARADELDPPTFEPVASRAPAPDRVESPKKKA